ncbi:hypothetical protein RIR_jg12071.t1 [Rhizophagus irregularis DAOM 181602=DAOM 197198]|nr:hypothetical protein RhiirB3_457967 [Rhizophagus irregularis]GET61978.1 hypothetical protein RIR_jg12071.t1 [Rhizophagus irregularis DAOM 181602=DAOM 197198]
MNIRIEFKYPLNPTQPDPLGALWIRESDKKGCLINYYDVIDEFLLKVIQYQYGEQIYQNPYTKHYILVFQNEYSENYCKICGEKKYTMLCNSRLINNLKVNFTKWTSENEQIDVFIKKRQLQIMI